MTAPDLAAMNATMSDRILSGPPQPFTEGGYVLRVLRTTGRRSGLSRTTPLGVVQHRGGLYLVSPNRDRAWVRNLAADPTCVLDPGDDARTAVPAPPEEAAPVVSSYLGAMSQPWALRAFPVGQDASHDEIAAHLHAMAVLRLDPR